MGVRMCVCGGEGWKREKKTNTYREKCKVNLKRRISDRIRNFE